VAQRFTAAIQDFGSDGFGPELSKCFPDRLRFWVWEKEVRAHREGVQVGSLGEGNTCGIVLRFSPTVIKQLNLVTISGMTGDGRLKFLQHAMPTLFIRVALLLRGFPEHHEVVILFFPRPSAPEK
jgi:hypothetical protein